MELDRRLAVTIYPPVAAAAPMPSTCRFHCSACGAELPNVTAASHLCPVYPFGNTAATQPLVFTDSVPVIAP